MILIVGSNHDDVIYFQSALKDAKEEIILNKYRASIGTILNQNVMVLQDVYTSYVSSALLTHIIEKYFVLMVFVVGTCFAQNKALKVGDIAISEMATFGDVDQIKMLKGTNLGQIPGYPQLFYSHKELIRNMEEALNSVGANNYMRCTFMNSSYYRRDEQLIEELSMEDNIANRNKNTVLDGVTTGVALAAHLFDIPFISVKVIEGQAGQRTSIDSYMTILEEYSVVGKAVTVCIGEISRNDVLRG
ncbi:MAG: hypothetical protein J5511_05545 [Bacilli bacterium]|nr:hypothetical protein [Bacilli bacterium]